jgi:hypothetical protein
MVTDRASVPGLGVESLGFRVPQTLNPKDECPRVDLTRPCLVSDFVIETWINRFQYFLSPSNRASTIRSCIRRHAPTGRAVQVESACIYAIETEI